MRKGYAPTALTSKICKSAGVVPCDTSIPAYLSMLLKLSQAKVTGKRVGVAPSPVICVVQKDPHNYSHAIVKPKSVTARLRVKEKPFPPSS